MEGQSVLHSRLLAIATAAALVTALLLASLPATAQADPFCPQTRMNVVAHQDDDLIFQSPDLLEAIAAGDCVRTVFVTAGDAGLGEAYWREREEGSRAAYAVMAGVANSWTRSESTVAGHTLHIATLTGKPTVSQVYMRLPNGGQNGTGYAATGFKSLPKLWRSHNPEPAGLTPISELSALDGSATYTYEGLLATLEALIAEFEPEVISTQDFTHEFGTGDHADHITVAKLTRIAADNWTAEHVLRSYMDYESKEFPVNVFEPQLAKKLNAYYAYAAHDSNEACTSQLKCEEPFFSDYWAWLKRQNVLAETSVPGADAGPDQAVASKSAVTLDGSGSSDPLGHTLSYEWKQTAGTTVTLSNSHAAKPTFTAPTGPASLTFSLVVKSAEAGSRADSVTVSVAAPKFALKVTRSGNGSGTVTSSPAGIECGSDCEESYEQGTKVTLSPSPTAGSEFKGWSGTCSGTGACEVTMSAAKSVGAEFALQRHALSVSKSGTGSGTVTSSPAGIECGVTCAANFDHGTLVKLTGTPAAGSKAVAWGGCDKVNGADECEVTMGAAKSVTATFDLESHQLAVIAGGSGSGTVTSSPSGIECGSTCSASFIHGTVVKLAATSAVDSEPVAWGGCGTISASNECEVTMSAARDVTATFTRKTPQLSVTLAGTGSGTVTSAPAGIECGATCAASFDYGTEVTLSASPAAGSKDAIWNGCDAIVGSDECKVTTAEAKAVTARFDPIGTFTLKVKKAGNGAGTVTSFAAGIECGATCEAVFAENTKVKLVSSSAAGSDAVEWSGCDAVVGGECEVTMSAAKEVTATYTLETHSLNVVKTGSGQGTVTSSPAGIECGPTCEAVFDHGTELTLTALPDPGTEDVVWSGCDEVVGGDQCKVSIDADREVSAKLDPVPATPEETPIPTPPPTPPAMPNTKLLKSKVEHGRVMFVFAARGATKFHCALARLRQELKYKRCTSPTTYRNLSPGRYVFKVKAVGPGGADTTPATRQFKVHSPQGK
jgi:LmbE family N-acetylglucosaminyl deacetylase